MSKNAFGGRFTKFLLSASTAVDCSISLENWKLHGRWLMKRPLFSLATYFSSHSNPNYSTSASWRLFCSMFFKYWCCCHCYSFKFLVRFIYKINYHLFFRIVYSKQHPKIYTKHFYRGRSGFQHSTVQSTVVEAVWKIERCFISIFNYGAKIWVKKNDFWIWW